VPPVIVSVAAYAASAWAAATAAAAGWSAFAIAATRFAASFVVSAIGAKLLSKSNGSVGSQERRETLRSPIATRRVIYGEVRTGGTLVHAFSTGDQNKYLHLVIALAHGEVEQIDPDFWLGNLKRSNNQFDGKVYAEFFNGTDDQPACQALINAAAEAGGNSAVADGSINPLRWTADHRLQGIAYVYVRLEYDTTAFPSGIPQLSFRVRGRKVWDPRNPSAAPAWSRNAALCVLDYLRADHGMQCPDSLINVPQAIAAANICDESIQSIDSANAGLKRYECDGVIDLGAAPASIVESMQTAMSGHVVFSACQYCLYPGGYSAPVAEINADMLRGDPVIRRAPSRSELFNTVRGVYIDPRQDYQEVDYEQQVDEDGLAEDGAEIVQTLDLPFTSVGATAQRLAKIALGKARGASSVKLPLNWAGLQLKLWDVVTLDLPGVPALQPAYRVTEFTLAEGGGVDVTLQAESAENYAWDAAVDEALITVSEAAQSLGTIDSLTLQLFQSPAYAKLNWHLATHAITFQVQWRRTDSELFSSDRQRITRATDLGNGNYSLDLPVIERNVGYTFRVRAVLPSQLVLQDEPAPLTGTTNNSPWVEASALPLDPYESNVTVKLSNRTLNATSQTPGAEARVQFLLNSDGTSSWHLSQSTTNGSAVGEWRATGSLGYTTVVSHTGPVASYPGSDLFEFRARVLGGTFSGVLDGPQGAEFGLNTPWARMPTSTLDADGWPYGPSGLNWSLAANADNPTAHAQLLFEIRNALTQVVLTSATVTLNATYTPNP
jgi:hypothetical protein